MGPRILSIHIAVILLDIAGRGFRVVEFIDQEVEKLIVKDALTVDPGAVEPRSLIGERAQSVSSHYGYSLIRGETKLHIKIVEEIIRCKVWGRKHGAFALGIPEQVSIDARSATNMFKIKVDFVEQVVLGHVNGSQSSLSPTVRASDYATVKSTHITKTSHWKQEPGVVRIVQVDATVATFRSNTIMKSKANKLCLVDG